MKTKNAWQKISPTWPLQNIIACNPLQGLENIEFDAALKEGFRLFKNENFNAKLEKINAITIKYCQVFFDKGQATIAMPNRDEGFYQAFKKLAIYDEMLHENKKENLQLLKNLAQNSSDVINAMLQKIAIEENNVEEFLTLLLTSLAGFASYVKYLGEWSYEKDSQIQDDYLAIRLIIAAIIWPEAASELIELYKKNFHEEEVKEKISQIIENENNSRKQLLQAAADNVKALKEPQKKFDAQMIFCIDVRSEPIRKAIEECGNYETFGFAGFFGVPTAIANNLNDEIYNSCPVLLTPKHKIVEAGICSKKHESKQIKGYSTLQEIKKFYQALKYNFTTPLPLAEGMGIFCGGMMFVKTFYPKGKKFIQNKFQNILKQNIETAPKIDSIPLEDCCAYAYGMLKAIGLTRNFSKTVILCGHGSQSENNTYATALDCGACGGRHGDSNAKIMAAILNNQNVREFLRQKGIAIAYDTKFYAAKHNTTTDEITIYQDDNNLSQIKIDLLKAKKINNLWRAKQMGFVANENKIEKFFFKKSNNWSETQPEWALARNALFIAAPRNLTKNLNLQGRSFLHSYDWQIDDDNAILNLILNAPMVVAQWINSQYLFSTIDNVTFGSGSKITQNVTAKIGVMQGNSSDLMHGLSLQSVYENDDRPYHQAARLATIIYAPSSKIDKVLENSEKIRNLAKNSWIKFYCLDPRSNKIYGLEKNLLWQEAL